MTILFNSDNNLTVHEEFRDKLKIRFLDELKRFTSHITRLEVHLSDANGQKHGGNDKNCLLEARVEGRQPLAVKAEGNSYELAVDGAITKLKSSLDKAFGRREGH